MFQPFRLFVNLVPRVVEEIMEETLQQTVVAKNLQGSHLAGRRQTHAVVLFVFHERRLLCRELLQHSSYGSGADTEMMGRERCWSPVPLPGHPAPGSLSNSRLRIPWCTVRVVLGSTKSQSYCQPHVALALRHLNEVPHDEHA